jgi:hypothetical protein
MWKTGSGDRALVGAERRLFSMAVGLLANWLDEFHQTEMTLETGAHLFLIMLPTRCCAKACPRPN